MEQHFNMEENESFPLLLCLQKPAQPEFENLKKIYISSQSFTLGRGLKNSTVVPYLSISRLHCTFKKTLSDWHVEDNSTFGIEINNKKLGKGNTIKLSHNDVISLEPSREFIFKFIEQSMSDYDYEIPRKRMKIDKTAHNKNILNDVKMKFEESQSYEIKHIEDKIQNAKQMQTTSKILKEKLQLDMKRQLQNLQSEFESQTENLKGEKNEVERLKALLIEERDAQLAKIKKEMESKISELMEQIQKHNESESELLNENCSLKEKLWKEREEFLLELDRESTSKQEMLEKLGSKMKEQEEVRLREKQELEAMLKMETEQLRIAKEKELKELEEQKKLREKELQKELKTIKQNLRLQMKQIEQEKAKAEKLLNEKIEQMKVFSNEEKAKTEQFELERKEMEKKHNEAEINAQKSLEELKDRVMEREIQLAALAAERIQKQSEQSSEVISILQGQLEEVKKQLVDVLTEKKSLLENQCVSEAGEGSSKQTTLTELGELMESELQCSICSELFVSAITLSCSHTFCTYCITMWKKKKKDCPICRTPITSECRSIVLDSFIERMVQNLTEEMKAKREDMLKFRKVEVTAMMEPTPATLNSRRRRRNTRNTRNTRTTQATTSGAGVYSTSPIGSITNPIQIVDLTAQVTPTVSMTPVTAAEWPPALAVPLARPLRAMPHPPLRPLRDGSQPPPPPLRLRQGPPPHSPHSPYSPHTADAPHTLREVRPPLRTHTLPSQMLRIIQRGSQTLMVVAGGMSPARLVATTTATGGVTPAARTATGHTAALSDSPTQ